MPYYYLLAAMLSFAGCLPPGNKNKTEHKSVIETSPADSTINYTNYNIQLKPDGVYANNCAAIKRQRAILLNLYNKKKIAIDSVQNYFTESLLNKIIPHWYGTKWSFEGHTTIPGEGEIACGYLVSTTLTHAGLNINRYKVAQQTPYNEARTYACGDSVYHITGAKKVVTTLLQPDFGEGFYFIGLTGSHVGLLLKRQRNLFFIHSDYVDGKTVIEEATASPVLNYYYTFYITPLSTNSNFIKTWLTNEPITVITAL